MNEALQTILTKLETSWGPAVLDVGTAITFWSCVNYLVIGFVLCVASFVLVRVIQSVYRALAKQERARYEKDVPFIQWDEPRSMIMVATAVLGGIGAIAAGLIGICMVLNVWNWVGIFNPRLRLAYDLYQAAIALVK
jgi:uncharacterized membrane protein YuzA (DUF378 family)